MFSKRIILYVFVCIITSLSCYAQMNLPTKKVGNKNYYYYKVSKKETLFGIAKKLGITQEEIIKYNPSVESGLQETCTLFFPMEISSKGEQQPTAQQAKATVHTVSSNFTHIVEKGETIYGIAKTYNVSQEAIIAQNPAIINGLRQGQLLIIPQSQTAVSNVTAANTAVKNDIVPSATDTKDGNYIFHTIAKGETLFNLSKKYNTSIEKILALNQGISPSNFKIGDVIRLLPNSIEIVTVEKKVATIIPYEVKKGDTYYSIAHSNGITVESLIAANSNAKTLKKGKIISIPIDRTEKVKEIASEGEQNELSDNKSTRIKEIYNSVHSARNMNEINVALLLPYMLNHATPSKSARLYTEFYKGFMLAVDDVRKTTTKHINIFTYDTQDSQKTLDSLLNIPKLAQMDMIFAPDDEKQITTISTFGKKHNIDIINTFSVKNDDYDSNPNVFQVNIPHPYMYAEVIDRFQNQFRGYEVVFISHHQSETKDFAKELINHLKGTNEFTTHALQYGNTLLASDVDKIVEPGKKYIFVPLSSSKSTLSQIIPALKNVKAERFDADIALFGYPEWSTYMNDYKNDFFKLDTYIYTRFFCNQNESKVSNFESRYKKWYGENMIYAAPQFGLLGYDTGMYFLKSLSTNNKDFNNGGIEYKGLQTDFKFQRLSNWSGFVNKSVYIIHFTPNNSIVKSTK